MSRIVDLTMVIEEGMQTFPTLWHPFVEVTQLGRHGLENRETRRIVLGTHTGTHIDAPRHFIDKGTTVESLPLDTLVGEAAVLDFTDFAGPAYAVQVADLERALQGRSPKRILMRFDWDRLLGSMKYYDECPYLSDEAATWLVDNGCVLLAMDTPMPDNPKNGRGTKNDSPVHKILLGSGVILVEYMVNFAPLPTVGYINLVVAPLKIKEGDGAPARAFAILDDYE